MICTYCRTRIDANDTVVAYHAMPMWEPIDEHDKRQERRYGHRVVVKDPYMSPDSMSFICGPVRKLTAEDEYHDWALEGYPR